MTNADKFWDYLEKRGFDFFAGVPCSILEPVLKELAIRKNIRYIPAVKENVAIGLASGAYTSGKKSGILIQNSGVGNIINALTSFNLIYKIPVLMFITWRGFKGKDAPEHLVMGQKTVTLLKTIGIPVIILSKNYKKDLNNAIRLMNSKKLPVAVILKKDIIVEKN